MGLVLVGAHLDTDTLFIVYFLYLSSQFIFANLSSLNVKKKKKYNYHLKYPSSLTLHRLLGI